jgi:adenine-specific DNA-methyltransferase
LSNRFELHAELSCGSPPWQNLIIEGDNYEVLQQLASTHAAAFHLIYIDAPYNTGRRDLVYHDRYLDSNAHNRHLPWIEFMHPRLALARGLLRPDGAIFVSIDDRELFNLGHLMNQVFGEECFVANCIWQKRYSRENRQAIGDAHEYLLVYSPDPDGFKKRRGRIPLNARQARIYRNPDNPNETDPARRWRGIPMTAQGYRPNQMYTIVAPNGTKHVPPEGRCWSIIESEFQKLEQQGRIYWGKDGSAQPSIIRYLCEVGGLVPWTWWTHEEVGHTDEARKEIQDIFGSQTAFHTPKPVRLLERILQIGAPEKDALILDFFAGSGTTAQAVLQMNRTDGGTRRFVLAEKDLARDVCAKRVRSVIEGYQSARSGAIPGVGGNFAYLTVKTRTPALPKTAPG